MPSPSRNQPCPCGSGKKYKHCCAQAATNSHAAPPQPALIRLETGQWLPAPQALVQAIQLHQAGRVRKAEAVYRQIVEKFPRNADAQHLLGLVQHQTGRHESALAQISLAISLTPGAALFHNNLGEVYRALGRLEEAHAAYSRALALQPSLLEAHRNLGLTLLGQDQPEQAAAYLRQVLERHPAYLGGYWALLTVLKQQNRQDEILQTCDAGLRHLPRELSLLHARGHTLKALGQPHQAAAHYRQAIEQQPDVPELHRYLAVTLLGLGDTEGTIECLRNEVRLNPDDASARHLLDSLLNAKTDRAPAAYVSELFDSYADNFDRHLVGRLEYRTHILVAQAIREIPGATDAGLDILDLGCGTGLFGEEVRDIKKTLAGIDLSPRMIERCRERKLYDTLVVGDLVDYLATLDPGRFDLIVATDVFVYLGNLQPVFRQAARILTAGHWFAFSLEAAAEGTEDFVLSATGRYQHGKSYIERLCAEAGFAIRRFDRTTLRKQNEQAIAGYICLLERQAAPQSE